MKEEENGIHAFDGAGRHIKAFLNKIKREYEHEENSKVVDEYISKVNSIFEDEFSKNKESFNQDRKTTVDKINVSIKKKIEKLNDEYKNKEFTKLIKCEFSLYKDAMEIETLRIDLENSHSEGKAKKLVKESNLHRYFPAFYNEDTTLAEDNNNIVKKRAHSIKHVNWDKTFTGRYHDILDSNVYVINGVKYDVDDNCIKVSSASGKKVALEIPKAILDQKLKFIIGPSIEKLKLAGDEEIDISNASDLKYVDTTNSTRYRFEEGIFYDGDTLLSRVFTECRF